MVTAAEHQALLAECSQWLETLRNYREKMNGLKNKLYQAAAGKTDKDYLTEVEHYHNQFHIQLINIHDLKHAIKHHIAHAEHHPNFGHKIPHHHLEDQLNTLLSALDKLADDYDLFLSGS